MKSNMNIDYDNMTNDEILELFKNQYYKIKPQNAIEFQKKSNNTPSQYILKTRLSLSYGQALVKIGVRDSVIAKRKTEKHNNHYYNKWKNKIIQVYEQLGYLPNSTDIKKYGIKSENLVKVVGMSYINFCKNIGFKNEDFKYKNYKIEQNEEALIQMYKNLCIKLGKIATSRDIDNQKDFPSSSSIIMRFGSMNNLKRIAGFNENKDLRRYLKFQFMKELKNLYIEHERKLTYEEILEECKNNIKLPDSAQTISTYFKTTNMSDVWEEVEHEMIKDYIKLLKKDK